MTSAVYMLSTTVDIAGYGYVREDGVAVIPVGGLGP